VEKIYVFSMVTRLIFS